MRRPRVRRMALPLAAALFAAAQAAAQSDPGLFQPGEVPAGTGEGGYRYFEVATDSTPLNLRSARSASSERMGALEPGTLVVNLGCAAEGGRAWCDVQPVGGGPRGYTAAEFLRPGRSPLGGFATGEDDSAFRAGQGSFDATGTIPCATAAARPAQCPFGVARSDGGDGTVIVTRPDGRPRAIFFSLGRAIGADTSEADPGDVSATRTGDTTTVTVGTEIYEIQDAVLFGG